MLVDAKEFSRVTPYSILKGSMVVVDEVFVVRRVVVVVVAGVVGKVVDRLPPPPTCNRMASSSIGTAVASIFDLIPSICSYYNNNRKGGETDQGRTIVVAIVCMWVDRKKE